MHDWVPFHNFNFKDCIPGVHRFVKRNSELLNLIRGQADVGLTNVDVEIGGEVVHVGAHRVAVCIDAEKSDDWRTCVFFLI